MIKRKEGINGFNTDLEAQTKLKLEKNTIDAIQDAVSIPEPSSLYQYDENLFSQQVLAITRAQKSPDDTELSQAAQVIQPIQSGEKPEDFADGDPVVINFIKMFGVTDFKPDTSKSNWKKFFMKYVPIRYRGLVPNFKTFVGHFGHTITDKSDTDEDVNLRIIAVSAMRNFYAEALKPLEVDDPIDPGNIIVSPDILIITKGKHKGKIIESREKNGFQENVLHKNIYLQRRAGDHQEKKLGPLMETERTRGHIKEITRLISIAASLNLDDEMEKQKLYSDLANLRRSVYEYYHPLKSSARNSIIQAIESFPNYDHEDYNTTLVSLENAEKDFRRSLAHVGNIIPRVRVNRDMTDDIVRNAEREFTILYNTLKSELSPPHEGKKINAKFFTKLQQLLEDPYITRPFNLVAETVLTNLKKCEVINSAINANDLLTTDEVEEFKEGYKIYAKYALLALRYQHVMEYIESLLDQIAINAGSLNPKEIEENTYAVACMFMADREAYRELSRAQQVVLQLTSITNLVKKWRVEKDSEALKGYPKILYNNLKEFKIEPLLEEITPKDYSSI